MSFFLLVLDCDGVIVQSVDAHCEAMRRIGEPFGKQLCERLVMFQQMEGGVSRFEKFRWLYREAYGREITGQEMDALSAEYAHHLGNARTGYALVPGLHELLARWHGNVPLYVCSGAPQKELEHLLAGYGIAGRFTRIGGYPPEKTSLLRSMIAGAGVAPEEVVMVGDTVTDVRAAEANGTQFFGIGSMFTGSRYPCGPDLHALNEWLKNIA